MKAETAPILILVAGLTTILMVSNTLYTRKTHGNYESTLLRVATFNISLAGKKYGDILDTLEGNSQRIRNIAEIIQVVSPDIIFLQEIEYDSLNSRLDLLRKKYLEISQNGKGPVFYPYQYHLPSNTGKLTGFDLDKDGRKDGPYDAHGWGLFEQQFGIAVLSKFPINRKGVRTFRTLKWKDLPFPHRPVDPMTNQYYWTDEEWESIYLSSKNHFDIPVLVNGETLHLLGLHPQNSIGDGAEYRNSLKNFDEIGFFLYYLNGYPFKDDLGKTLQFEGNNELFILAGDLNSDPFWNGSISNLSVLQLLNSSHINQDVVKGKHAPRSDYGNSLLSTQSTPREANMQYVTRKRFDGQLERIDYVLPSSKLRIVNSGVFWPDSLSMDYKLVKAGASSDHRLVYVDIILDSP